jgi:hypothetical protein
VNYRIIPIILSAILCRCIYYFAFRPEWVGDSGGYSTNCYNMVRGYLPAIDGGRTPIYPLFLGFTQWLAGSPTLLLLNSGAVYLTCFLQMALGIISAVLIFDILKNLGCSEKLSQFCAIGFGLIGVVVMPELQILPQAPESFLLILSVWLLQRQLRFATDPQSKPRHPLMGSIGTGLVFSIAILTRPDSLLFLMGMLLLLLAWSAMVPSRIANPWRLRLRKVVLMMAVGSIPLTGAWMTFNFFNQGYFTITTLRGSVQTSALRDMFGRVDPEDQVMGDIINKRYLEVKAEKIHWPDYITSAWPKLMEKSNEMPFVHREAWHLGPDLNNYMGEVSWKLIRKHPFDWLRNAAESFTDTFSFASPLAGPGTREAVNGKSSVKSFAALRIVNMMEKIENPILSIVYVLALMASFGLTGLGIHTCWKAWHKKLPSDAEESILTDSFAASIGLATIGSFIGYTLFACYLPRYGVSYLGPLVLCVGYSFHRLIKSAGSKPRKKNLG